MDADVEKAFRAKVADMLCVEPGALGDDARLVEDLNADSLDLIEISVVVEEDFDVLLDDELEHIGTVKDLFDTIERKLAKKG